MTVSGTPTTSDPLVSTVIPTYNRRLELARAVQSAVDQTYPAARHEILVVDDGSRDLAATQAVVAPFGARVRLLSKPNGGVSSARNFGIQHAAGELIAFLDSDDVWRPQKLRRQVDHLRDHADQGMVLVDFEVVDADGRRLSIERRRDQFPRDGRILADVLLHPRLIPSTALLRRPVLDRAGLFDTTLATAEDVDFLLRVARGDGIGVISEPLTVITRREEDPDPESLSARRDSWDDYMRVIRGFVARHGDEIPDQVRHRALLQASLRNARGLILSGLYRSGVELTARGALHVRRPAELLQVARLALLLARNLAGRAARRGFSFVGAARSDNLGR